MIWVWVGATRVICAATASSQTMATEMPSEAREVSKGFAAFTTVVQWLWFRLSSIESHWAKVFRFLEL